MNNRRLKCILAAELIGLGAVPILLLPEDASAHTVVIQRDCTSVTLNSHSDGTASILAQTGGVFTVGQTIAPNGHLTMPAAPSSTGTVQVTWTTDHSTPSFSWSAQTGCQVTTTSSTSTSTSSTSTSTSSTSTSTSSTSTSTTQPVTTSTTRPSTTTTRPTTTSTRSTSTSEGCTSNGAGQTCVEAQPPIQNAIPATPSFTG